MKQNKTGTNILYVGNKLSQHGFTPGVIETLGRQLELCGYKVYYAGTKLNPGLRLLEMIFKTISLNRKVKYVLIDTYSSSAFWYAFLVGAFCKFVNTKYITILHGGDLPARLKRSKWACDKLFKYSHANVAVSEYLKQWFEKAGYQTIIIPNNIELSKYPFKIRLNPQPKLLWVRSFHRQYNPTMAADVLAIILKTYTNARLCMVGPNKDGSLEEFNEYVKKQGLLSFITTTGRLSKEEWIELSKEFDFFLNTTNFDNTPISVIEAMALGMCVISTDPGGIPFLLQNRQNAYLVKPNDSNRMAEQIDLLIKQPEYARAISTEARATAEKFAWGQIKSLWQSLLQ